MSDDLNDDRVANDSLQPIDVLLGQGEPEALAAAQARIAEDPLAALELAETIDLVERLREARVQASPTFGLRLRQVAHTARRRQARRRHQRHRRDVLWLGLAAAATFVGLLLWDPAGRAVKSPTLVSPVADLPAKRSTEAAPSGIGVRLMAEPGEVRAALDYVAQKLDAVHDTRLQRGLLRLSSRPTQDALLSWLQPQNLLASLRLDFERRGDANLRAAALHARGASPDMDERIQALANSLAADADAGLAAGKLDLAGMAFTARALAAAGTAGPGGPHARTLTNLLDHLVSELHEFHRNDGERATALYALAEVSASTGRSLEYLQQATTELAQDVLAEASWDRQRPTLLLAHTSAQFLGDCGRLLLLAPAFGVDADLACRVRVLLAAHLEERRLDLALRDDPGVMAAQVYGFADLVDRESLDRKLRGRRSVELAPDYHTVQQLAWSREPGGRGFAQFQLDLRALAALPTPEALRDRAALLLCLATDLAAPGVSALSTVSADPSSGTQNGSGRTGRGN